MLKELARENLLGGWVSKERDTRRNQNCNRIFNFLASHTDVYMDVAATVNLILIILK